MASYTDLPLDNGMFYGYPAKYTCNVHTLRVNGFDFGLDSYPIWNESFREPLNLMILDWYDTYEIGFETERQFRDALRARMAMIMPKYNVMFKSRNLTTEPLTDHNEYVTHRQWGTLDTIDHDTDDKTSKTTEDNDFSHTKDATQNDVDKWTERKDSTDVWDEKWTDNFRTSGKYDTITRHSDTPQQNINHLGFGLDDTWINQWLTDGTIVNNTHSDESTETRNTHRNDVYGHDIVRDNTHDMTYHDDIGETRDVVTDYEHGIVNHRTIDTDTTNNYDDHMTGRHKPEQELAQMLYETAYDIEMLIIKDLGCLFMSLYDC